MLKDIIGKFTIEELNVILKGIRQNTHYEFYFIVDEDNKPDESADKIKGNSSFVTGTYKSTEQLFINIIQELIETNKDDRILIIDQREIAAKAIKYFYYKSIDIVDLYFNMNIYDYLGFINSNPANEKTQEKIKECEARNGSIVTFQLIKDDNSDVEGFIFQNYPSNFDKYSIDVRFGYRLFELVRRGRFTHKYPFVNVKENNALFAEKAIHRELFLLKPFTVNVSKNKPHTFYGKHGISLNYAFESVFDIVTHKIIS